MSGNITANASQEDAVRDLFATRYLTVSAVVIILYDTILSFETERAVIWKSKISAPKAAYVVYRYLMVISTLISLNSTISARNLSNDWCGKAILMISITMFSADAVGHCLVIFRTFMLWERRPSILRLLCVGSLVVNATAFAFLVLSVRSISDAGATFIGALKTCAAQVNPKYLLGVWAPQVVFDIYVLALIIWNAMDRPRLPNQKILEVAYEDGLFLILVTWVLRALNTILCTRNNALLPFISISFAESLITTINLRLLLRIFQSECSPKNASRDNGLELDVLIKCGSHAMGSVEND